MRGEAALDVERDGDDVVWTLRVNGLGLERDGAMERAGAQPARSTLDLALAREHAASLGGTIVIAREPGHGRTCSLRLPSHPQSGADQVSVRSPGTKARARGRVMASGERTWSSSSRLSQPFSRTNS